MIVLMLWFYISGLAMLVGAEMNAEIEHASPHGKAPGEKVPGEKKKLGAAAARAYEERQRTASLRPAAVAIDAGETTRDDQWPRISGWPSAWWSPSRASPGRRSRLLDSTVLVTPIGHAAPSSLVLLAIAAVAGDGRFHRNSSYFLVWLVFPGVEGKAETRNSGSLRPRAL